MNPFYRKPKEQSEHKAPVQRIIFYRDEYGEIESIDSQDPHLVLFNCSSHKYDSKLIFKYEGDLYTTVVPYHQIVRTAIDLPSDYYTNMLED